MTTNHTELCERLISDIGKAILGEGTESLALVLSRCAALLQSQAARIQQQALEYASLFDQCSEAQARIAEIDLEREQVVAEAQCYQDRIAELEKERDAAEKHAAAVSRENFDLEARIAELEKERDALKADAERYEFLRRRAELREFSMGLYWHIKTVDAPMGMPLMDATLANVIDAALQAEKETR